MISEFKLYHVDISGLPHLHIFAGQPEMVDVLTKAYLITNNLGDRRFEIHPANPQNLSRMEREQLQSAIEFRVAGLGVYDADDGWEIFSVFDYPG